MSAPRTVIVTDSSAYIPDSYLANLDVRVIPLWLIWDDEHYQDGLDITPETFYSRLKTSGTLPTSSQPSAREFEEFFLKCLEDYDSIVSVLVSSKVSGTVECARMARDSLRDRLIEIVDSGTSSMGLGFTVRAAALAAATGKSFDEIVQTARVMRERVRLMFVVDTLKYLHRGGRISGAKRLMGTALQIKPILHFHEGLIQPLSQARTRKKSLAHLLDLVDKDLAGKQIAEACVVNIDCPEEGKSLVERVKERFQIPEVQLADVSPVVGTHVGPGGLGIAFYAME
jgi:DegV family protein with EDD domain